VHVVFSLSWPHNVSIHQHSSYRCFSSRPCNSLLASISRTCRQCNVCTSCVMVCCAGTRGTLAPAVPEPSYAAALCHAPSPYHRFHHGHPSLGPFTPTADARYSHLRAPHQYSRQVPTSKGAAFAARMRCLSYFRSKQHPTRLRILGSRVLFEICTRSVMVREMGTLAPAVPEPSYVTARAITFGSHMEEIDGDKEGRLQLYLYSRVTSTGFSPTQNRN
jgi:hypothetical protein